MSRRSSFRFGNRVLQGRNDDDKSGKGSAARSGDDCRNAFMSSANRLNEPAQGGNGSCVGEARGSAESTFFRDDINTYFGDQLPASVIADLCKLVKDNTHGKCSSCKMPAESLVLGVLHILSDAAQTIDDSKENAPPTLAYAARANAAKDFPVNCSQHLTRRGDVVVQDPMKCRRVATFDDNAPIMNKKSRGEGCSNHLNGLPYSSVCAKEPYVMSEVQGAHPVNTVMNLCADKDESDESRYGIRTDPGHRFPVTKEYVCHYNAICELAKSHCSSHKAIVYSVSTIVTYSSLGGSVKPGGQVDKFFVAGVCRYLFETIHPRQSKKHFFYPKVGGSLYTYHSQCDTTTVERSFTGANSAHKLNWSHKLCFPILIGNHWLVFLVDLKKHIFVFLDSFSDSNADFKLEVRSKLINAFIECWHKHVEGYINFNDFTFWWPEVPKHSNVADCGIFAVKFMELWDKGIDLRNVFDQNDIPNIRVKLAIDMFFSDANSVDKSTVICYGQQGMNIRGCN